MPHRALVMSGGGSRGAFELGAADYLIGTLGLDFDVIAGVSTGSLNAVMLAQGRGVEGLRAQLATLKQLWFGLRSSDDIYKKRFLGSVLAFVLKDSIYSSDPVRRKIEQYVDPARLQASGRELRIGAVVLETGEYRTIDQRNPDIRAWTLASASMPLFFPPVKIGGQAAVDGGVRNVTPLTDAFRALNALEASDPSDEPCELYVVLASPLELEPVQSAWKKGLDVAKRGIEVLVNEVFLEDLSYALAVNRAVRSYTAMQARAGARAEDVAALAQTPFKPPRYREARIRTILPDRLYSETLEFDPAKIRAAFDGGRVAAQAPRDEAALEAALGHRPARRTVV